MFKFSEIEENILKLMAQNQENEKEFLQRTEKHEAELEDLEYREKILMEEYNKVRNEQDVRLIY